MASEEMPNPGLPNEIFWKSPDRLTKKIGFEQDILFRHKIR